ncbi:major facilitator superfamily domain-containing protein, partial [Blyttiomyces helicus]
MARITTRHWVVLATACLMTFGNYYCYDIPGGMSVPLQAWLDEPMDNFQWLFNAFYTAYSIPNAIVPLIAGVLIDRIGTAYIIVIMASFVVSGQTLFALGITLRSVPLMMLGRVLLGIGGESLDVVQARVLTDWFK